MFFQARDFSLASINPAIGTCTSSCPISWVDEAGIGSVTPTNVTSVSFASVTISDSVEPDDRDHRYCHQRASLESFCLATDSFHSDGSNGDDN